MRWDFWQLRHSCVNHQLDITLIDSTTHLKESFVTPILIPRVSNQPVRSAIFLTPANDPHSVPSKVVSVCMLINTRRVKWEISIDIESSGNGAIGFNLLLDKVFSRLNVVAGRTENLVIIEALFVVRVRATQLA